MNEPFYNIINRTGLGVGIPILGGIMPYIDIIAPIASLIGVLLGIGVGVTALYLNIRKIKKGID